MQPVVRSSGQAKGLGTYPVGPARVLAGSNRGKRDQKGPSGPLCLLVPDMYTHYTPPGYPLPSPP